MRRLEKVLRNLFPQLKKSYGIKLAVLDKLANEIANRFENNGFAIVEALFNSGIYEEQILAAKILGKICKNDPIKSLNLIKRFTKKISDWAGCDTLATQGIRKIAKIQQKEIFELAKRLVSSKKPLGKTIWNSVVNKFLKKKGSLKHKLKKY